MLHGELCVLFSFNSSSSCYQSSEIKQFEICFNSWKIAKLSFLVSNQNRSHCCGPSTAQWEFERAPSESLRNFEMTSCFQLFPKTKTIVKRALYWSPKPTVSTHSALVMGCGGLPLILPTYATTTAAHHQPHWP